MQNPLSTEALISWLEKQPADGRYNYCSNWDCLIAKYLKAAGFGTVSVGDRTWSSQGVTFTIAHDLPKGWDHIANGTPHTYGAALERARDLQANG